MEMNDGEKTLATIQRTENAIKHVSVHELHQ